MSNDGINRGVGVRIVTLSGCDYCIWLKSELDGLGISYINIDADEHTVFADSIEQKFGVEHYPIVFIDSQSEIITILSETNLETSDTLRTFDTIPHLVGIIKSYIK
jgi:glutaredoxin